VSVMEAERITASEWKPTALRQQAASAPKDRLLDDCSNRPIVEWGPHSPRRFIPTRIRLPSSKALPIEPS
jgi:hypothetical protein